jgi:hypothetical protein
MYVGSSCYSSVRRTKEIRGGELCIGGNSYIDGTVIMKGKQRCLKIWNGYALKAIA